MTVTLTNRETGEHVGTYIPSSKGSWEMVAREILYFLRLEINPYWNYGDLIMTSDATQPELIGAIYAISPAFGWNEQRVTTAEDLI